MSDKKGESSEEEQQSYSDRRRERKRDYDNTRIQSELRDIQDQLAKLLAGKQDGRESAREGKVTRPRMRFETPEGRAALESAIADSSKAKTKGYAKELHFASLYDLTSAGYNAEGDVWADLQMMFAGFTLRRSKWRALTALMDGQRRWQNLTKLVMLIIIGVVASLTVYGVFYSGNFQVISQDLSSLRAQLVVIFTLSVVLVVAVANVMWTRRKNRPAAQLVG